MNEAIKQRWTLSRRSSRRRKRFFKSSAAMKMKEYKIK